MVRAVRGDKGERGCVGERAVGWDGGKEVSDSAESEHKEGRCRRRTLISISLIGTISKHIHDIYSRTRSRYITLPVTLAADA